MAPSSNMCAHIFQISRYSPGAPHRATSKPTLVTFVGKKILGENVTAFALAGYLESLTVLYIDAKRGFAVSGDKIRLPITEVLLCAIVGDLALSNKLRDWTSLNAILLPPFLTEAVILDGEISATVPDL